MKKLVKDATINGIITRDLVSFKSSCKNSNVNVDKIAKITKDLKKDMISLLI